MARYIDADKLIEELQPAKNAEWNKNDHSASRSEMIENFCTELQNAPTAEVVPKSQYDLAVEEMREKIRQEISKAVEGGLVTWTEFADWLTQALYNANYRKQSENTVEVVRCKDCVWWEARSCGSVVGKCENPINGLASEYVDDSDFCSYGRPKMKGGAEG